MDIDLIYLWVDGNDPVWLAKKNAFLPAGQQVNPEVAGECRYVENDELRYSLRSVEKYAPWIRRVYIVTDDQTPPWLDTSNPRVRVVSHREILPAGILPVFNSTVIELFLHRISGLAEHFLFANDDMLFNAPVGPDFFFDAEGRPVARLKKQSLKRHLDKVYPYKVYCAQRQIQQRWGKLYKLAPHHNVDAYRKSDYAACMEAFREDVERTSHSRFRKKEDFHRSAVLYYALALGHAVLRPVNRYNGAENPLQCVRALFGSGCRTDSRCIPVSAPDIASVLEKYRPQLFCLNDDERATVSDRMRTRQFLDRLFPEKSSFEK